MGEAKRRRLLDPNYAKAKIPDCFQGISHEFFQKSTDLEILSFCDSVHYKRHLIMPTPSDQNDARHLFVKHQQQVMNSIIPLIQEHGFGWIAQTHDYQTDCTKWGYVPATSFSLKQLQCEVFSGDLGLMVGAVIGCALES